MTPLATFTAIVNLLKIPIGAVLLAAFAAADLWHFHALSATTDVSYLVAAAGAVGVSAGVNVGQVIGATTAAAKANAVEAPVVQPPTIV